MNPEVLMDDRSGRLLYWPDALQDLAVTDVDHAISWRQDSIRMFGRTLPLPRLTAWYGDPAAVYAYSGIRNEPSPWNETLLSIKDRITELTGNRYNSVLANRYADGSQSMSWHADDEAALGSEPQIASVSLGATRRFLLKHKKEERRLERELTHGSLLLMAGRLQEEWVHALPRTRKPVGLRINLTFRLVQS
ncbi:MAG TPA: alpha-ketoglutarate-dependent dioxygenase AlkB [Oligoflexus sp.]|uniref:alpha-ketoglutarate-dependent dioxygenase AlkB family protein n=1 Tax=Oligoflexus sp. TaxID=1971216 RepID=UPI002D7ED768|nr:alpha-ketoglutarate-dependent dioxygenase AlkB [Oligoflexus sp.]HET9238104.1 alpha-ketoglutarate-dependent dioxygenase AlkB [Oligoflexus sp.]